MNCFAGAGHTAAVRRAQRAHEHMRQLGFIDGEDYVLLCGTNFPSTIPTDLPKGTYGLLPPTCIWPSAFGTILSSFPLHRSLDPTNS